MINDVKLIYITCGFLRLICSALLTVCSHFKVNLSIGQFISFQKEQRLLPVFPLLNATVRIIEPLATTFRKELLSGRSEVQILLATPKTPPKTLICARHEPSGNACISFGDARVSEKLVSHVQGFRRFLFSEKNRTHSNVQLARANSANQSKPENNRTSPPDFSHKKSAADLAAL